MVKNVGRLVSLKEAAALLNVSYGTMLSRVTTGKLVAYKFGKSWAIPEKELQKLPAKSTRGRKKTARGPDGNGEQPVVVTE